MKKKLTWMLALLLMLSAMTASGCVVHEGFHHRYRWHYWR
jgi:hypothetical protein